MQTLRIVITLSHLRALHDALRETFLKVTNNEIFTAKRHRSQLKALWCLRRTVGRIEKKKKKKKKTEGGSEGRGGQIEVRKILSTATSTQIPNHKANKKKDTSKQLSKVVKEVQRNYNMFANPFFVTSGRFMGNLVPRSPTAKGKGDLTFQCKTE